MFSLVEPNFDGTKKSLTLIYAAGTEAILTNAHALKPATVLYLPTSASEASAGERQEQGCVASVFV